MDRRTYLKTPIIVDLGCGEIKAGFNGSEQIACEFPNYIGEPKYKKIMKSPDENEKPFIGKDCDKYMGILKLRYPLKHGVFKNEQDIIPVFKHMYSRLDVKDEEIKEHPIFITEPILNPMYHRKQVASALLETLGVPEIFFASQPILSLYACNDKSGIILESGEGITQCAVVYEGYAIPHSYTRYDFGGRNVTEYLQNLLRRAGTTFTTTSEFEITKKIKESLCYTIISSSLNDDNNKKLSEIGPSPYTLPDGNHITLREEKITPTEILFNPGLIGLEHLSFPEIISTTLGKVDLDIRTQLYSHILLSGGNTLFKGLPEKLTNEVKKLAPKHMKVKLHAPNNRKNLCWTGASIVSSLASFKNMWVTKQEYSEKGERELFVKTI